MEEVALLEQGEPSAQEAAWRLQTQGLSTSNDADAQSALINMCDAMLAGMGSAAVGTMEGHMPATLNGYHARQEAILIASQAKRIPTTSPKA